MKPTIGLRMDGTSALFHLTPAKARSLFVQLRAVNGLTQHELAQCEMPEAFGASRDLVQRLFWKREQRVLPAITHAEVCWLEHLFSRGVTSGTWRVSLDDGGPYAGTLPLQGRQSFRRVQYVVLFGAFFVVERLPFSVLVQGPSRSVLVQLQDRSLRFWRFEKVCSKQGLQLLFRERLRLAEEVLVPMETSSEQSPLQYFAVKEVFALPGFHLCGVPLFLR